MLSHEASLEAARRSFHITESQVLVGLISGFASLACILFHYEVMSLTSRLLPKLRLAPRARIVMIILAMLAAHVVEVWIFGLIYWLLDAYPSLGHIDGNFEEGALDFIYFSVTSFTTIGFGDVLPRGAIRILCGTEALVGLSLIAWSASLCFLEMQRDWVEYGPEGSRGSSQGR